MKKIYLLCSFINLCFLLTVSGQESTYFTKHYYTNKDDFFTQDSVVIFHKNKNFTIEAMDVKADLSTTDYYFPFRKNVDSIHFYQRKSNALVFNTRWIFEDDNKGSTTIVKMNYNRSKKQWFQGQNITTTNFAHDSIVITDGDQKTIVKEYSDGTSDSTFQQLVNQKWTTNSVKVKKIHMNSNAVSVAQLIPSITNTFDTNFISIFQYNILNQIVTDTSVWFNSQTHFRNGINVTRYEYNENNLLTAIFYYFQKNTAPFEFSLMGSENFYYTNTRMDSSSGQSLDFVSLTMDTWGTSYYLYNEKGKLTERQLKFPFGEDSAMIFIESNSLFSNAPAKIVIGYNYAINTDTVKNTSTNDLIVYPNPASKNIYMSGPSDTKILLNAIGKLILTTNSNTIDVSALPEGIYFIKCGNKVQKVFIH